jgi:hypothetical protein
VLPPPPQDELTRRLAAAVAAVRARFGDDVVAQDGCVVRLRAPAGACAVSWVQLRDEIVLQVGTGGRWELPRDAATAAFVEDVLEAVLAGRVIEVLGPGRAAVAVTLADGRVERTFVRDHPPGCLHLPRWRPGPLRQVAYEPFG